MMFSADIRSYLSVTPDVGLWRRWLTGDAAPERQLFPGLVTIVGSAAALWPGQSRRRVSLVYACIAMLACVLSLGPEPTVWGAPFRPPDRTCGWCGWFRGWMAFARLLDCRSWCCWRSAR